MASAACSHPAVLFLSFEVRIPPQSWISARLPVICHQTYFQIHYLIRGPKWINSFYSHCLWRSTNKILSLRVFFPLCVIFLNAFLSRKYSFCRSRKANLIKVTLLRDPIPMLALKTKLLSFSIQVFLFCCRSKNRSLNDRYLRNLLSFPFPSSLMILGFTFTPFGKIAWETFLMIRWRSSTINVVQSEPRSQALQMFIM